MEEAYPETYPSVYAKCTARIVSSGDVLGVTSVGYLKITADLCLPRLTRCIYSHYSLFIPDARKIFPMSRNKHWHSLCNSFRIYL